MITAKLQKAVNDQIAAELWSSNLYLQMSLNRLKSKLNMRDILFVSFAR